MTVIGGLKCSGQKREKQPTSMMQPGLLSYGPILDIVLVVFKVHVILRALWIYPVYFKQSTRAVHLFKKRNGARLPQSFEMLSDSSKKFVFIIALTSLKLYFSENKCR